MRRWVPMLLLLISIGAVGLGGFSAVAEEEIDFSRDILPILSDNCFQCHGPDAQQGRQGDLRLDDEEDAKRDRGGYRVIAGGHPELSELLDRLEAPEPSERMPPPETNRRLTPAQIERIRQWIEAGAEWGLHWAFEPVRRPPLPADKPQENSQSTENQSESSSHPIDQLVNRVLQREGLSPNPPASRRTLIRRLSLDLTGLPPTPEQIEEYLADEASGAWERLVERLLASPAYGERMAWEWLEAARYADSNGYQGDRDRTMWPWRDWVVRAFNENLPYDQFTIQQLAGDQLPNATKDQILATGFNRNHMINGEGGRIAEENRVEYVMDMTETMGTVWLGMTLNCCRCHDHKFDPLTQQDYYRFTAFFNQTPVDGAGGNPQTPPLLTWPTTEQQQQLQELDARLQELEQQIQQRLSELPEDQRPSAKKSEDAAESPAVTDPQLEKLQQQKTGAQNQRKQIDASIPKVMVMQDRPERRATFLLDRGLYNQQREEVSAGVPVSLPGWEIISRVPNQDSLAGEPNRLDLARWLVSREHPLTARVTVNRYWQMLFGVGLVKTSEDFGVQAEYPVQRELLDWLAVEFMDSGWDVKHLLRTIVTSETYQRSSEIASQADWERDPENRLLARGSRYRRPSWMLRDQALAVSGLLNAERGGRPVYPYQPEGVWAEATFGKQTYMPDSGEALYRRSLYTFWRRIIGPTLFFDTARRQVCEVKPLRTNTPMQALTLMNDVTFVEASRVLAERLLCEIPEDDTQRLREAGLRILCREPSAAERKIWQRTIERATARFATDPAAADRFLTHGEAPREESLSVVQHAAWTALCLNLLNLDETLTRE